ncbi:MAG: hypothetical protein JWR33_1035 [Naasia sp.]|jgi:hypothetical protein|uniref:hypothetical protein n=1 Tax=Naasia sp. TaxID=2546198 RepID=UPI002633EE98|nr:hypothetical protein [Naasia sp.]MCU1570294.1 hypothetical protein [Naasia sp.]
MRSDPLPGPLCAAVEGLAADLLTLVPRLHSAADCSWRSPAADVFRSAVDAAVEEILALTASLRALADER